MQCAVLLCSGPQNCQLHQRSLSDTRERYTKDVARKVTDVNPNEDARVNNATLGDFLVCSQAGDHQPLHAIHVSTQRSRQDNLPLQ